MRVVSSTDEQIRELERRVAAGDESAWDELRRARNRAGHGKPVWMADLLEKGLREVIPIRACGVGVRAVFEAAGIANVGVRCVGKRFNFISLSIHDEATATEVARLFAFGEGKNRSGNDLGFILHPLARETSEGDDQYVGAKLAPGWQDVFLDAVRGRLTELAKTRPRPVDRSFQRRDVVKLDVQGKRYVVGRVEPDGQLTIVPLSGRKGPSVVLVPSDQVMLDEDQSFCFAHKARERAYERLGDPD